MNAEERLDDPPHAEGVHPLGRCPVLARPASYRVSHVCFHFSQVQLVHGSLLDHHAQNDTLLSRIRDFKS